MSSSNRPRKARKIVERGEEEGEDDDYQEKRRSNYFVSFDREAVLTLKRHLQQLLRERHDSHTECRGQSYVLSNPPSNVESNLVDMIPQGMFIDKTRSYKNCLDPQNNRKKGVRAATFPRRFGKTTWLSFMDLTLGPVWRLEARERKALYQGISRLDDGNAFLLAPLRPVLHFDLLNVETPEDVQYMVYKAFHQYGITVDAATPFGAVCEDGIAVLKHLYQTVIRELEEEKVCQPGQISPDVLVLVDEYDAMYRESERDDITDQKRQQCEQSITCITRLCRALKKRIRDSIWNVCIVSLVPLGHTGLSELDVSENMTLQKKYHSLFGISEQELFTALQHHSSVYLNLDTVVQWAQHPDVNIVPANTNMSTTNKVRYVKCWMRKRINRFCMAIDKEDEELDPLYSPLDVVHILQLVFENKHEYPQLQWLERSCSLYGHLLANHIRFEDVSEALCGGVVSKSLFYHRQKISEFFSPPSTGGDIRLLLFYLGLLQVSQSDQTQVVLLSSDDSRSMKAKFSILTHQLVAGSRDDAVLYDNYVHKMSKYPDRLFATIRDCIKQASRRIKARYKGFYHLREIPYQDALYHCLCERFRHDDIAVAVEDSKSINHILCTGPNRMDLIVRIYPDTEHETAVVIEVKREDRKTFQVKTMKEALDQALRYRAGLHTPFSQCFLCGIVIHWHKKDTYMCFGKWERGAAGLRQLGDHIERDHFE
eukprot:gb/GECG01013702.1/.p1 GENE.gb/GECG01013702.1/~~gb/GECG01013702.1/.p1  ORF type:complete len:711 (+),score=80.76 gb/GECG01013702.1/:1-2133(+)